MLFVGAGCAGRLDQICRIPENLPNRRTRSESMPKAAKFCEHLSLQESSKHSIFAAIFSVVTFECGRLIRSSLLCDAQGAGAARAIRPQGQKGASREGQGSALRFSPRNQTAKSSRFDDSR